MRAINTKQGITREPSLDYSRVFVAYLVIFGHLLYDDDMTIRPFIYAFHMPFFFLISGMLHKTDGTIQWKKYLKTLGIPFLVFNLIFMVIRPTCYWFQVWDSIRFNSYDNYTHLMHDYITYGIDQLLHGRNKFDGPTWFLVALLWCKIAMDIIHRDKRYLVATLVLFVCICIPYRDYNIFFLKQGLQALPFFVAGFYLKGYLKNLKNKALLFKIALCFVALITSIYLTKYNGRFSMNATMWGAHSRLISIPVSFINAFIGSLSVLALSCCLPYNKCVTICAKALISILCLQNFFNFTFTHIYGRENIALNIIASLIILILCVVLHNVIERYCPIVLGKTRNPLK